MDERSAGEASDLYGPVVLPTGAIPIDTHALQPGDHRLTFRVAGKNPASRGYAFGIDAVRVPE